MREYDPACFALDATDGFNIEHVNIWPKSGRLHIATHPDNALVTIPIGALPKLRRALAKMAHKLKDNSTWENKGKTA